MINPNTPPIQSVATQAGSAANPSISAARTTFKAILSELKARPMKPLSLQRFPGLSTPRTLAQQINSDTAGVV
ncbi:hypothetical protein [Limnobacter sp.]|jgi:hypothetical protein|uniref:hypothetical protein n=1 Tax=Limnobacter sp. TaxID=2003368 RepID=UPI00311F74E0